MVDIQTVVTSATESVKSSIIKPRFRDEDVLFSTVKVYEEDEVLNGVSSTVKYTLPGSNNILFLKANYFMGLFYISLRFLLTFCFTLYQYYLWLQSNFKITIDLLKFYFWYVLSLLPLPKDYSVNGRVTIRNSTSVTFLKAKSDVSFLTQLSQKYTEVKLLPTRAGNFIFKKSLSSLPKNRMEIKQTTGFLYIPEHISFIFEMSPLVVPQPPEVPLSFLDYEKRMVVPDKKEVARVLAKRAEWLSLHHTHKAAEIFRVIYESAKCIAWAACSGVRIVTVFESNGYAWGDLHKISNILKEELNSLNMPEYQLYDSVKLINLTTLEVINVYSDTSAFQASSNIDSVCIYSTMNRQTSRELQTIIESDEKDADSFVTQLESTSESSPEDRREEKTAKQQYTFCSNLTIFFMSNKEMKNKKVHTERAKFEIAKRLGVDQNILSPHYPFFNGYYKNNTEYVDPDIIYKFCNQHQMPNSLCGYPLSTFGDFRYSSYPVFTSDTKPASFLQYLNGLRLLDRYIKKDNK